VADWVARTYRTWRTSPAVVPQPHHAAAFGLPVEPADDQMLVVVSVAAVDELDALLAR
jgi:hypothetical protein